VLASLLALSIVGEVRAAEVAGIKLEDSTNVGGTALVLNGAGLRTKLMLKIYVMGLYLPAKTKSADAVINSKQARLVRLVMKRDLGAATVWDAFDEGIQTNSSPAELKAISSELAQIEKLFKDLGEVKENDVIDVDFAPDGTTSVSYQKQSKGTIPSAELQKALLKIWLGAKPVQKDLKEALLGGH
jgi:long-chain acyl-CoA synthetase